MVCGASVAGVARTGASDAGGSYGALIAVAIRNIVMNQGLPVWLYFVNKGAIKTEAAPIQPRRTMNARRNAGPKGGRSNEVPISGNQNC